MEDQANKKSPIVHPSVKLTAVSRDRIIEKLLLYKFGESAAQLVVDNYHLSNLLYEEVFANFIENTKYLPKKWFVQQNWFSIHFREDNTYFEASLGVNALRRYSCGGRNRSIYFDGISSKIQEIAHTKLTANNKNVSLEFIIPYTSVREGNFIDRENCKSYDVLLNNVKKHIERCEELSESISVAATTAKATVYSFKTTKALCDNWPEVTPFVNAVFFSESRSSKTSISTALVAVNKLNVMFDLPVEEVV